MRLLKLWLPVIVWSFVILWASSDDFSSGNSQGWLAWFFGREVPYAINFLFRKGGHIVAYAILGALSWRADRRVAVGIAISLIVAVTDESRQSMTVNRSGSPWDVLLDVTGSWLGIVAMRRVRPAEPA